MSGPAVDRNHAYWPDDPSLFDIDSLLSYDPLGHSRLPSDAVQGIHASNAVARGALARGDMPRAASRLVRPLSICGHVTPESVSTAKRGSDH